MQQAKARRLRAKILAKQGRRCWYCGKAIESRHPNYHYAAHLEHQTPTSRGGSDERANLVVSCHPCNAEKRSKTVEEYREYLWLKDANIEAAQLIERAVGLTDVPFDRVLRNAVDRLRGRVPRPIFFGELHPPPLPPATDAELPSHLAPIADRVVRFGEPGGDTVHAMSRYTNGKWGFGMCRTSFREAQHAVTDRTLNCHHCMREVWNAYRRGCRTKYGHSIIDPSKVA